jgi:hypothetical protein
MFDRRRKRKLEKKRTEALSSITGDKIRVELMAQRWRTKDDSVDEDLLAKVLGRLTEIESGAKTCCVISELDDLIDDGESQGIASAYFCPADEIEDEGSRAINNLELWGIPKSSIKNLREAFAKRLSKSHDSPEIARAALHAIFIEVDEWEDYIDDYEETMQAFARRLFGTVIALLIIGSVSFYFAHFFPLLLLFGLIAAGGAGSSASVLAKMPSLDVSLSGELEAYRRRIQSRIAAGTIGSLIGTALLGWGVLPLALKGQTFTDALDACGMRGVYPCSITKVLIVFGVAVLLGVSERTLTSFEQHIFGDRTSKLAKEP